MRFMPRDFFMCFLLYNLLINKVTFVKWLLINLIFLTKLFYWKTMNVFEMDINYRGTILSIIFCCHTLFIFQLYCLSIHEIHFFNVTDSSILVTKFIQIILYFYFRRWLFIFTIGLIHFWYNFNFLLNGFYGFFTLETPCLCSDVFNERVLTRLAFLWILRCNVDRVHL